MMSGVISMGNPEVDTPDVVAARVRGALQFLPADRVVVAPDCGMKYLPREIAFGKLQALVEGTAMVRYQL